MKNLNKALLLLIISVLFLNCSGPKSPSFKKLENVEVTPNDQEHISLKADAIYHNPNPVGGMLTYSDITISIDGVEVSHIKQEHAIAVPQSQDFAVPILIDINGKKVLEENKGFLKNTIKQFLTKKLELTYKGTVTIQVMNIEFDVPIDYTENVSFGLKYNEAEKE